jgi:hypothetical protein
MAIPNFDEKNRRGRPFVGEGCKKKVYQKLEPYLCSGLSMRKACSEARVSRTWVYTLKLRDKNFANQIARAEQYLSVLVNKLIVTELFRIIARQQTGEELSKSDLDYLMWFAIHSTLTREEFGRREAFIGSYDPETEIQRLMGLMEIRSKGDGKEETFQVGTS